jgi:hypothetical protein
MRAASAGGGSGAGRRCRPTEYSIRAACDEGMAEVSRECGDHDPNRHVGARRDSRGDRPPGRRPVQWVVEGATWRPAAVHGPRRVSSEAPLLLEVRGSGARPGRREAVRTRWRYPVAGSVRAVRRRARAALAPLRLPLHVVRRVGAVVDEPAPLAPAVRRHAALGILRTVGEDGDVGSIGTGERRATARSRTARISATVSMGGRGRGRKGGGPRC